MILLLNGTINDTELTEKKLNTINKKKQKPYNFDEVFEEDTILS